MRDEHTAIADHQESTHVEEDHSDTHSSFKADDRAVQKTYSSDHDVAHPVSDTTQSGQEEDHGAHASSTHSSPSLPSSGSSGDADSSSGIEAHQENRKDITAASRSEQGKHNDPAVLVEQAVHAGQGVQTEKNGYTEKPGQETSDDVPMIKSEHPVVYEELPERIEWYTRGDFKQGTRPLCRISRPYILSNGTVLLPDWMGRNSRLLKRCGLDSYGFYAASQPLPFLGQEKHLDVDFALTVHLSRFQEPTHDPSIYLTEHILKASYLFDAFSGYALPDEAIREEHCSSYANKSEPCSPSRPLQTAMKPALFVPKRIETGSKTSWTYKMVNMFGAAYGHGQGVTHLNISSILSIADAGQTSNLTGTQFRSIMTMDGMFRHLPLDGLKFSNMYSPRTGVDKAPKIFVQNGKCTITIGIIVSEDGEGIQGIAEMQSKLDVLVKFALPEALISFKLITMNPSTVLSKHMKEVQDVDIFLGSSGSDMNSISFMRPSSTVVELMPFGFKTNTHESFASALGMQYESLRAKPQTESFKKCIESEVYNLRKKGTIKFTELPEWHDPLMKEWDVAVADFSKSGSSDFNVLTAEGPIRNYHTRACASKQAIDVAMDETARKVIIIAKNQCGTSNK